MLNFSYTLVPSLKKELENVEKTRDKCLLVLLNPRDEAKLRWDSLVNRLYTTQFVKDKKLSRSEITNLVTATSKRQLSSEERQVAGYKRSLDYIVLNWSIQRKPVTSSDLAVIAANLGIDKDKMSQQELKTMLEFVQINPEHPVVQAGLIFILLMLSLPESGENEDFALLSSLLFLYKHGFDFRGQLMLEEYFANDSGNLRTLLKQGLQDKNISTLLEYYVQAVSLQGEKTLKKLENPHIESTMPESFFSLSERQKEILSLLARPGSKVTNKQVQKQFKVSQITASRDLSKLASLGFIFSGGRGRSVYYTKV